MIRRFLRLFCFGVLGIPLLADGAAARPNILLIYTDDQSHRTLSCYPGALPWVRTPHIDALAAGGMRFAPSYIGAWCAPARTALLTGLHSSGVRSMRSAKPYPGMTYDPELCRFWPADLRKAGYVTAQIGKWHSGNDAGFGRDWDFQVVWNRCALTDNALHYYSGQQISINGAPPTLMTEEYSTDCYTRHALEFVRGRQRDGDRPWFLWLCYDAPHGPFIPAERHRTEDPDPAVPVPPDIYPPRPGKPAYMQAVESWIPGPDGQPVMRPEHYEKDSVLRSHIARGGDPLPSSLAGWAWRYQLCVDALDESVGQLLEALRETGQWENTLVIYTSDQGLAVGQHGFLDKHAPYDANIAAPLIFSLPGRIPAGSVCEVAAGGVDLAPTILAFAGLAPPWPMHGRDLGPLLRDPSTPWPHPALLMNTHERYGEDTATIFDPAASRKPRPDRVPWWVLLRQGRFKYIRTLVAGEAEELYDLAVDPDELDNLAAQPAHRDTLVALRQATIEELRRVEAPFVDTIPEPLAIRVRPRTLGPAVGALSWREKGPRMRAMGFEVSEFQDPKEAEQDGLDAMARVSPSESLGKRYPEMNRDGTPRRGRKKTEYLPLHPEVRRQFEQKASELANRLAPYAAWKYLNIAPERRRLDDISFDEVTRQAWRAVSGLEIPDAVQRKTGVDYRTLQAFPESRILPDEDPMLRFYRWYWREGEGWPGLYTAASRAVRAAGRDDVVTFFAPALRVPSLGGITGEVDALFHWGYVHPDPARLGKCADELLAMARAGNRGQRTILMTQLFTKRAYVTPEGAKAEAANPYLDLAEDNYFTITPDQLEIAFWSKVSRPLDQIAYNGLRNILPADWDVPPAGENSTTGRLRDLLTTVLQPLGATLALAEDPEPRIGFLQSFTAEMFAGRGSYGWPFRNWQDDAYLALLCNGIQPGIFYDDAVQTGGADRLDALVLVHCDVLPASVAAKILAFQKGGGMVVGDEHLAPGIRPDILWKTESLVENAAERKATVIAKGRWLRERLESRTGFPLTVSDPNLLVRLRVAGQGRYLFVVNDERRSGDPQGRYGLVMENGIPSGGSVWVAGRAGAVYDLRQGKAIPFSNEQDRARIDIELGPGEGTVLLLLDRPVAGVKIEPDEESVRITVHDGSGAPIPAALPVSVEVITPAGRPGEFSGWHSADEGALTIPLEPGPRGSAGPWVVQVREGASGRTAGLSFKLGVAAAQTLP